MAKNVSQMRLLRSNIIQFLTKAAPYINLQLRSHRSNEYVLLTDCAYEDEHVILQGARIYMRVPFSLANQKPTFFS
jgi:hypothetical protein